MTTSTSSNGRFDSLAIDPLAVAASLTEAERITLLAGADTWHTAAVPRVGLASLRTTDGPSGARGTSHQGPASACFPCGTSLASSWDPDLVHEIGAALGREAR